MVDIHFIWTLYWLQNPLALEQAISYFADMKYWPSSPLPSEPKFDVLIFISKQKQKQKTPQILPAMCYHCNHYYSSTCNLPVVLSLGYSLGSSKELLKSSNAWVPDKLKPNFFYGVRPRYLSLSQAPKVILKHYDGWELLYLDSKIMQFPHLTKNLQEFDILNVNSQSSDPDTK